MGEIQIPGNLSGQTYSFRIAGDQPTPEELQRMQAILQRDEAAFAAQFEADFGLGIAQDTEPGTAIGRGLRRGVPQFQSALGSAAGAVGLEGLDEYLQSAATDRQLDLLREDPALLEGADFRDVRGLGSALTYTGELIGEQLPIIGGTVGATGAAALAGASLPVSAAVGTVAVSFPQLFGSNIQRQEQQVAAGELADVDVGRAAATAVGQTVLETISNVFLAGRIPGGVLRSIAENAPVEALTELGQQALERQQAGLPLDSEDAYREYLDAAVAGGVLGGVFGAVGGVRTRRAEETPEVAPEEAPAAAPTPQEAQDVAPVAIPDPAGPITPATLDELGVPKGAPVYKQFPNLSDRDAQLAALEGFADVTKDRRLEGRIRTYVEQARAADLAAVSPTLFGIDEGGAGDGVRGAGGVRADSTEGAGAPDAGGLDVSGAAAGPAAGAATEQRTALTEEEAFELAAQQAAEARMFSGPLSDAEYRALSRADKQRYLKEVGLPPLPESDAGAARPAPEPAAVEDTTGLAGMGSGLAQAMRESYIDMLLRRFQAGKTTDAAGSTSPALKVARAIQDRGVAVDRTTLQKIAVDADQAMELPANRRSAAMNALVDRYAPRVPEVEAIPGFDEMPEGSDVRGVDPFDEMPDEAAPKAQEDITAEEIEPRAAAAPEPEPTPEPEGLTTVETGPPARNIIPGQTAGAAGQVIPEGITPAPGREPELRPTTEGEAEINAARARKAQQERAADTNAAAEIRRKFAENSPELQEFTREEVVADPDRDITSVEDKQAVVALLDKKFTKREKTSTNPEWAAHEYFRKHADVMTALDTIAYDAIAAPTKFAKITNDMSPGAKEYYSNTGRQWGTTAGKWVLDNLSRDARLAVFERLDFYRPEANKAVQRAVADSRDAAVKRDRQYREYMGDQTGDYVGVTPDTEAAQELGFGTEDLSDLDALFSPTAALDMPMHPQVTRAFMRGDINAALDGIIATAGSPEAAKLAAKLRPFVQNITLRSFTPEQMANVNAVLGDGRRVSKAGVYISRYNEADLQAAETYAPERVAMRRELGGSVILNSQTGFTPSTLLHELIHVATTATLDNKAHPLTKQVETLLTKAREIIPISENGLLNRYEFVSEAMTNPAFIQDLAKIDIGLGKEKFTLRQRIMHSIANFVRQLLGRPQKKLGTAKTEIDRMFDDLLAPEPSQRGLGSLYEAAFRPNGYRDTMNSMKDRVKEFTPKDAQDVRRMARSTFRAIPKGKEVKEFAIRASAPLMFVAETAQRYMPSAFKVYETVMAHGAQQHRMSQRVDETILKIQDWAKDNREQIDLFNDVRFTATELRMDPRKPKSEYEQFQLTYDVLDSAGDFVERKTLSFATREARAAKYKQLRDNPDPKRTPPKNSYDPETDDNKERLKEFDAMQRKYRQLGPGGQEALARAFDLPEYFRNEMKRVVQKRLDSMFEGQRTMQERIYKNVFEKIFADMLIDPYQALQRRGSYGLSYVGRDPNTGDLKVFKHAFQSTQERDTAAGKLSRLGPEAEISQITPYDMDKVAQLQARPSLEFITAVLNRIEARGQLAGKELQKEFLDLVFEATPESSFFRAYQQRRDVPGYEGDVTPLDERLGVGDTVDNIRRNGMHLAAKVADTEYQVALDKLRSDLAKEKVTFEQTTNAAEPDPIVRNSNSEEADVYLSILNDFTRAPFRERANWSRTLTAGGYALTLGFNVSTAALTFFQMPTIIYPYLAGKYGPRMSMQSIGIAMRLLTASGRERTIERVAPGGQLEQVRRKVGWYDFSVSNLDFTDPKNAYLQELHDVADQAGVFNRSLTQDILDETGAKGWVQKTAAYSGLMQHHTERLMRESTLVSTYLMELHKSVPQGRAMPFKSFVKAVQRGDIQVPAEIGRKAARDAVYTSDMTNGSVLAAAAPIVSQTDLGSVIYLFKRFPLSMLNMIWHTMKRAADSSNDPVDRRVAAMQFAGVSGSMAMFAGASGIPMFHTIAALYNLFKDDEDEDFETMIRTGVLGERGLTGLVDYYTGLSVSSRIGLSGVFYRPGFNTENQTAMATLLEGFGGPVVGLFNKYFDRVPYFFAEGEYYRMTEAIMPTAIGNAMKSGRFYTEGARTLRYDPILDEVGPFSAGAQFFGFMPTEYARQLAQNSYIRRVDNAIASRRTKLLRRRYLAYRKRDRDELRRVARDIAEFNRENPQYPITSEVMERSLDSHRETTSRMHHGITYSRKNEPLLIRHAEDFGPATAYAR